MSDLIKQDSSHNHYRKRSRFFIGIVSFFALFFMATTVFFYLESQERVMLGFSNDGIYKAMRTGKGYEKNDAQKRLHARMFFELMFAGNKSNYRERVSLALNLINKDNGMYIYNDMKKEGIFASYERYPNMRTEIKIDSIVIDKNVFPEEVSVYAVQYALFPNDNIITADEINSLLIAAKFNLLDLGLDFVSDKNPCGFLIQNFDFFTYNLDEE